MEKTIEELQIDLRVAEARIDLLFKYIGYMADELNRSEITGWNQFDLRKQFLIDTDYIEPADEIARMDLEVITDEDGEVSWNDAVDATIAQSNRTRSLREEIAKQIKHGEA